MEGIYDFTSEFEVFAMDSVVQFWIDVVEIHKQANLNFQYSTDIGGKMKKLKFYTIFFGKYYHYFLKKNSLVIMIKGALPFFQR